MERKLASIQKITEILPIEGAEKIVCVKILGWQCVALKTEFKVNDLCVFFEIDSILPIAAWNDHLRKEAGKPLRIKTIRLKGTLSQGLALPLSILPVGEYEIGQDVSQLLKIEKYEPVVPAHLSGVVKGNFPAFLHKTDEVRCAHADTVLVTTDGPMTIKEICTKKYVGGVLSYNEETQNIEYNMVTDFSISRNNNDWYEITLVDGTTAKFTGNHLIYLPDKNVYRRVDELENDDFVYIL